MAINSFHLCHPFQGNGGIFLFNLNCIWSRFIPFNMFVIYHWPDQNIWTPNICSLFSWTFPPPSELLLLYGCRIICQTDISTDWLHRNAQCTITFDSLNSWMFALESRSRLRGINKVLRVRRQTLHHSIPIRGQRCLTMINGQDFPIFIAVVSPVLTNRLVRDLSGHHNSISIRRWQCAIIRADLSFT